MTREEAIKTLKENYCAMCAYGSQDMDSCDIRSCDNKDAINTLEQESCEELDFVQPHKKISVNLEVCKMREVTPEERESINKYIKSISKPTGVNFELLEQEPIDKAAMMHEIYMEGVNMAGEYHGCWVRFKDIEKIVDKYMKGGD